MLVAHPPSPPPALPFWNLCIERRNKRRYFILDVYISISKTVFFMPSLHSERCFIKSGYIVKDLYMKDSSTENYKFVTIG